jgi:hypothetical protein
MGKLRHIAMSVHDSWKTAEFNNHAFGMTVVGGTGFCEVKLRDPGGVIFDISHAGWGGMQKDPGGAANQTGPSREPVPKLDGAAPPTR